MTFLKTVLIILLVYYGSKIILQFAKPYIIRYVTKKANERFGQAFGQNPYQSYQNQSTEGEVTIDQAPKQSKKSNPSVGEYVDYEEVE